MTGSTLWLSGGTGLLGSRLTRRLRDDGHRIRRVSRRPDRLPDEAGCETAAWDGLSVDPESLRGTRAVVHLAGEPVFGGLPTRTRRERIWNSRIQSTQRLVEAIADLSPSDRPATLICASAVGYYGDRGEEELIETAAPGKGFLADLCVAWEEEAARAEGLGLRRVSLRFGVVLARDGGALSLMAPLFRMGLGGRLGSGRQWFPWVHVDDAVAMIHETLADEERRGPVNVVAPEGVRNAEFTRVLGSVLGRPTMLAVPGFAVRTALGPLSDELLGSKHVRASDRGSGGWSHPGLESALRAELG
mgnify:CR=1 FL=1